MALSSTEVIHFMLAASILLLFSRFFGSWMEKMGSPRVVGEIGAGILLGPSVLGTISPDLWRAIFSGVPGEGELLAVLYWLGFAFLMFVTGYDMQFRFIRGEVRLIAILLFATTLIPFSFGFFFPDLFFWQHYMGPAGTPLSLSLVMGIIFSLTSIPVISKIFLDLHLSQTPFAKIILTVAGLHDLLLWGILYLALRLTMRIYSLSSLWLLIAPLILLLVIIGFILWRNGREEGRMEGSTRRFSEETTIASSLIILWLFSSMWAATGMDILLGGLIAGLAVRSYVDAKKAQLGNSLKNLSLSTFIPLYFALVGFQVQLTYPFPLFDFLLLFLSATSLQFFLSWLGARIAGQSPGTSLNFAAALNARGGPGIIVATVAYEAHVIQNDLFSMFILLSVLTSWIAGLWLKFAVRRKKPLMDQMIDHHGREGLPVQFNEMKEPVKQLTILLHDHDRHRSEPLYHQILKIAQQQGLKGTSIFRGIEGFGLSKRIQSLILFETLHHLPIMILIIEEEEKIKRFLPEVEKLLSNAGGAGGIYTLSAVEAIHFHTDQS